MSSTFARDVYIISDLHLGGPEGFQMMTRPDALAAFIERLTTPAQQVKELVIAGDFIDFLAEGPTSDDVPSRWTPLIDDPKVATKNFERIACDSSFTVVFEALAAFLQAGHWLTIMLGNHDIELSYPPVRQALERVLRADTGRRFRFIYDGEAYVIGDALIEHGNRYDRWNQVDHDALRKLRSLQSRSEPWAGIFEPPAGSRLVAHVMNPIKRDYAFVDLLKPEGDAVLPILLALEPGYKWEILTAVRALAPGIPRGIAADGLPVWLTDAGSTTLSPIDGGRPGDPLEQSLTNAFGGDAGEARAFLSALELDEAPSLLDASAGSLARSLLRILRSGRTIEARLPSLLQALRALQSDRSFDSEHEPPSSPYLQAADRLTASGRFRYVVFGHTHHARRITLEHGARYFNTGTWADLMRVPEEVVFGPPASALPALERFVEALRVNDFVTYRKFSPTYVHLAIDDRGCVGDAELLEAPP